MPFRHLPNSQAQRLAAMKNAADKYLATTNEADRLITAAQFAKIDPRDERSLYSTFKRDVGESAGALAHQADLTDEHDVAIGALAQVASHFIQVFNLAVGRRVCQPSDRAYYGLDINRADVPPLISHDDVNGWAQKIVDGEAARLAANPGAPAMAMPSVGDITSAQALVATKRQTQTTAKDAYTKEPQDVEVSEPAIDALITDMWDTIEFNLRTLDGPSRRRRAREWGIVYLTRPGEAPDPGTPPEGGTTGGGTTPG